MKRIVLGLVIAAIALVSIGFVSGCLSERSVKTVVSAALKDAYQLGGSTAVSNRIEKLAQDGKLTREQADALHTFAQGVYERVIDDLDGKPVASGTDACTDSSCVLDCEDSGEDDAYCGDCDQCRDKD